jgi:hypothetical protein
MNSLSDSSFFKKWQFDTGVGLTWNRSRSDPDDSSRIIPEADGKHADKGYKISVGRRTMCLWRPRLALDGSLEAALKRT